MPEPGGSFPWASSCLLLLFGIGDKRPHHGTVRTHLATSCNRSPFCNVMLTSLCCMARWRAARGVQRQDHPTQQSCCVIFLCSPRCPAFREVTHASVLLSAYRTTACCMHTSLHPLLMSHTCT